MCGRIDQSQTGDAYLAALVEGMSLTGSNRSGAGPRTNVPPGTYRPLVHAVDDGLVMNDLYWGYRPAWAEEKMPVAINARQDKITSRYWKHLLTKGRAIVPASSWYEWTGPKGQRQPWRIHLKSGEPLFLAAVAHLGEFKNHRAEAGFALITAASEGGMVDIHDRRPVVLTKENAVFWLTSSAPAEEWSGFLAQNGLAENFEWKAAAL